MSWLRGSTLPSVQSESVQAILGIARNAFVSLDADGRVLEWNRRATELFGYSRPEAIGVEVADLIVPERFRSEHRAGLRRAVQTAPPLNRQLIVDAQRRGGREFPVEVSKPPSAKGTRSRSTHGSRTCPNAIGCCASSRRCGELAPASPRSLTRSPSR